MTQTVDDVLTNLSVRLPRAHRIARSLRAGIVWVNRFDRGYITAPFGGFKQSGFGRDKSIHALDKYTDVKSIWIAID